MCSSLSGVRCVGGGVSGFVSCGGLSLYSSKCGEGLWLCLEWSGLCLAANER